MNIRSKIALNKQTTDDMTDLEFLHYIQSSMKILDMIAYVMDSSQLENVRLHSRHYKKDRRYGYVRKELAKYGIGGSINGFGKKCQILTRCERIHPYMSNADLVAEFHLQTHCHNLDLSVGISFKYGILYFSYPKLGTNPPAIQLIKINLRTPINAMFKYGIPASEYRSSKIIHLFGRRLSFTEIQADITTPLTHLGQKPLECEFLLTYLDFKLNHVAGQFTPSRLTFQTVLQSIKIMAMNVGDRALPEQYTFKKYFLTPPFYQKVIATIRATIKNILNPK